MYSIRVSNGTLSLLSNRQPQLLTILIASASQALFPIPGNSCSVFSVSQAKTLELFFSFFFFAVLGFELRSSHLARQALYHLSLSHSSNLVFMLSIF
jgi:hypothetical protein